MSAPTASPAIPPRASQPIRHFAFVCGNDKYREDPLTKAVKDAKDVSSLMKSRGYFVADYYDIPTQEAFEVHFKCVILYFCAVIFGARHLTRFKICNWVTGVAVFSFLLRNSSYTNSAENLRFMFLSRLRNEF